MVIGSRTLELTVVANKDILVPEVEETVSNDINKSPETCFSSAEDHNIEIPATSPITISPPVYSQLRFLERTHLTSLSVDLPVIRGWRFHLVKDASRPHFKQIELVRTIGARRLGNPEKTPIYFINKDVDIDDFDDIA